MNRTARPGAVIFTGDKKRLARFYQGITRLPLRVDDDGVTVLASEHFELVIHALPGEPPGHASAVRQDVYVKPFWIRTATSSSFGKTRPGKPAR